MSGDIDVNSFFILFYFYLLFLFFLHPALPSEGGPPLASAPRSAAVISSAADSSPGGAAGTPGSHPVGWSCWETPSSFSSPSQLWPHWSPGYGNAPQPYHLLPSTAPAASLPGTKANNFYTLTISTSNVSIHLFLCTS